MVLNAGHTIRNYRNAAMDSDGSITATGDKFVNNSNVNAKGNINITANEFRNEVEGGDTRVWSYAGTSFDGLRSEEHTSELQSLMRISYAVFSLKKKSKNWETKIMIREIEPQRGPVSNKLKTFNTSK